MTSGLHINLSYPSPSSLNHYNWFNDYPLLWRG